MAHQLSEAMHECIDRCQTCEATCIETVSHCLVMGGRHAEADHIQLLMSCRAMARSMSH